jgi:xanthine/CO dehydrogenase XdhC/CoxF family maturation factor
MDIYEEIVKLQRAGHRGAVATIVNVRGSIPSFKTAKMLVRDDGSICGTIGGGCVEAEVWQAAREVMANETSRTLRFDLNQDPKYDTGLVCGGTLEIFIEPILPPAVLYIFGAGHVAYGLYKVARNAGFEVVVADDREAYAHRVYRDGRLQEKGHYHLSRANQGRIEAGAIRSSAFPRGFGYWRNHTRGNCCCHCGRNNCHPASFGRCVAPHELVP